MTHDVARNKEIPVDDEKKCCNLTITDEAKDLLGKIEAKVGEVANCVHDTLHKVADESGAAFSAFLARIKPLLHL